MHHVFRWAATAALCATLGCGAQAAEIYFKHQDKGLTCQVCHKSAAPVSNAKSRSCMQCHNYDALAQKTAHVDPNPHDSHAGQMRCTKCHKEHKSSVNACRECHLTGEKFNFKVP